MRTLLAVLLLSGSAWAEPWLVMKNMDTHKYTCEDTPTRSDNCETPMCDWDKDRCEDFAYALNRAHEERTSPKPRLDLTIPDFPQDYPALIVVPFNPNCPFCADSNKPCPEKGCSE